MGNSVGEVGKIVAVEPEIINGAAIVLLAIIQS